MEGNWQGGAQGDNKHQYNDKEWNDDFGLGWNDYGARMYDPALGRWNSVDPLAEMYSRWSPYNYCVDNPMNHTDPTGMSAMPGKESNESEDYNNQVDKGISIKHFYDKGIKSNKNTHWDSVHGENDNGSSDTDPYDGWEELTKDKLRAYAQGQAGHCNRWSRYFLLPSTCGLV